MTYRPVRGRGFGSARDGLPAGKPYVYRGSEPLTPAERMAARIAASDTAGPGPDDVGYEWRREQLAELEDAPAHVIPLRPEAEPRPPVIVTPDQPPAAARCRICRYLETSVGHRVNCGA